MTCTREHVDMDERVLGDVPSEGSESGRRFGIYREHDPDLKMHNVTRNLVIFMTVFAAVIAFSIFYPLMKYTSKSSKTTSPTPHFGTNDSNTTNELKKNNISSNCSTLVFSFGHDCTEQHTSSTEVDVNLFDTQTDFSTPNIRRFDETSPTYTEEKSLEIDNVNLDDIKDFKFQRTGRSKWPTVTTPYPYYKPTSTSKAAGFDEKELSSQETNIFAIPYDQGSYKYQDSATPKINFTPPPYVFTPYPNFTGNYAQLSPYKVPQNNSNFIQVMKYLSKNVASERHFSEVNLETTSRERNTSMKVSGTYVMPLDRRRPGEIILSTSSDNIEEARPFFNGHAYVSDPFTKFRPTNPSDINRLIPVKSSVNTGPRFRKPVSFVPTSSIAVDITQPASYGDKDHKYRNSGSHTVAIFHPPTVVSQKPTRLPKPSDDEGTKGKPLSVVLDIYPVTVDSETDKPFGLAGRERGRLNPKWKPKATERPKWRPQPHNRPLDPDESAVKNHMIVHLNLFPNNRRPYSYFRRNQSESSMGLKTTVLAGGQFNSRTEPGSAQQRSLSDDETNSTAKLFNTSTINTSLRKDKPEFSALERINEEKKEESTKSTDELVTSSKEIENSTDYNTTESNLTTLAPDIERSGQSLIEEGTVYALMQTNSSQINATSK